MAKQPSKPAGGGTRPERTATGKGAASGEAGSKPPIGTPPDPWAETDAGHPDENSWDSLDQHPGPDDADRRKPGA